MDFPALQHSVFLQTLGSAILNSLWQAFILWFLYEIVAIFYKNASAKFKNNLSTALLFFSFIWFVSSFVFKIATQQNVLPVTLLVSNTPQLLNPNSVTPFEAFLSYAGSSLPYLSVAYILLLFFLMAKLFTAYRYVYIISNKRLLTPPAQLQDFTKKVSVQMGVVRKISVWISHYIDVPATIGFIKPVILIPFASLNNLSTDQLEAVILHELSHIKRNDYIINIIVTVIETILFFNPFVVLLSKVIKRERENCCDDFVLQYRYDPHSYATALLRLEQSRANNLKLAIGAVSGKKQLLSRIKRITNGSVTSRQFNYGQKLLALLFVTGVICSVAWLSPGEKKAVPNKVLMKENGSASLSKPDFSPLPLPFLQLNNLKENLQAKILKHILPKKEFIPFKEEQRKPDFSPEENDNLNTDEDTLKEYLQDFPLTTNLKQPQFFFDESKFKLPQSINTKNFPFQNGDFKVDLSMIDISKLNDNLKQAYKEINDINWVKVQKDIRESFSKIKIAHLPSKEQVEFFVEQAKEFSRLKDDKQKLNKESIEVLNKEIQLQGSLNSTRNILAYNNNARTQRERRRIQNQYVENIRENSYYNYTANTSYGKNKESKTTVWVNGNNLSPLGTKNIKISIKHLLSVQMLKLQKKSYNFHLTPIQKNLQVKMLSALK